MTQNWRGTSRNRDRGASWKALRRQVLAEEPTCRECPAPSVEVDHIVPLFEGGTDARANLAGMCRACHVAKTARESARARGAREPVRKVPIGLDGWPAEARSGD